MQTTSSYSTAKARVEAAHQSRLLTQKDLMARWNCTVKTVQRARKTFSLDPVDFYGVNPLFRLEDVERAEELRRQRGMARMRRQGRNGILTLKQLKARAKKYELRVMKKHQEGLRTDL